MAGSTAVVEDCGTGGRLSSTTEGMSSGQRCQSEDSLTELRSCGQVENGTPSTSPPFWDTDDDDDCGPKPSALYGKFTWKIENFSQINKRELRSNAFEVGGYKWYILIYPQGCDVCNHLSLFLCVANHDKLLPGWSHFAQFTIAVVNKDPKKSKYSDTLHRFWKKEHDWGWKKFMELSKVLDGFINDDCLVIKAQVQVIREKAHRPFRCLDCQYRRELVRVYLSNVEQICRRFIEERRGKLGKLIEDKVRWSSFRAFWLGIDQISRRRMSRDKTDVILKEVVKNFFIEKEVTSTLVMDSLYSGLKALECQGKNKKGVIKLVEVEELPAPMVRVEKDMFVLTDDVLILLERVALEPLPYQPLPPKDDKALQNRTKDGSSGEEFSKDSIERDERRLTELGRRTVEIFVLAHIFSRIEVAYQEAVALKRQEELIREEEAAEQAENELKAKRNAADKEKRAKKKQSKQKRRKGKDRGKDGKSDAMLQVKIQKESPCNEAISEDFSSKQEQMLIEKVGISENASDLSDTADDIAETIRPDLEDIDCNLVSWDTDTSEIQPSAEAGASELQNDRTGKGNPSFMDDSSSTCSTDSVPSVLMHESYKANSLRINKNQTSPSRGKNQRSRAMQSTSSDDSQVGGDIGNCRAPRPETEGVLSLKDRIHWLEQHLVEKEEEVVTLQKKLNVKDQDTVEGPSNSRTVESSSSLPSPSKKPPHTLLHQPKQSSERSTTIPVTASSSTTTNASEPVPLKEPSSNSPVQIGKSVHLATRLPQISSTSKSEAQKHTIPPKNTIAQQSVSMSRPSSAPLIPAPRPTAPVVSPTQVAPSLSRSVSAAGRLGTDQSPSAPSYIPQSYRNAIIGKTAMAPTPAGVAHSPLTPSSQASVSSASDLSPQTSGRKDQASMRPGLTFGSVKPEALQSHLQWRDCSQSEPSSSSGSNTGLYNSHLVAGVRRLDINGDPRSRKQHSGGVISSSAQGMVGEQYPHLDIINDLLDDDRGITKAAAAAANSHYQNLQRHHFNRQYSFPGDADIGSFNSTGHYDQSEQYYDKGVFQRSLYGSTSAGPIHGLRDELYPQIDLSAYATNGQMDGLIQNQWSYAHPAADLSMLNMANTDASGYPYQLPDYSSMPNGYNMYNQPGNGL